MSVQEIKEKLATLSRQDQSEVIAFLFQLRHSEEDDYAASIERRLHDTAPSHWVSPDEFEKQLNDKIHQ